MKNLLIEQARHPLHRVLRELKWGRPAASQKLVLALADELKRKNPRPVCPTCCKPLVRTHVEKDGETLHLWACSC